MVEYGTLKKLIHQSINTLLKYHGVIEPNALKDKSRRIQVHYLLKIIEILDKSPLRSEESKKCVLNAAAYFIHIKIKESYENSTLAYFQNVTNSDFFNSITTALGLRDINYYPNDNETTDLYDALLKFMESELYDEEGLKKGFKRNHSFSAIKGYLVEDDIKLLSKKLLVLKCSALDTAAKSYKEKGSEKTTQNGFNLFPSIHASVSTKIIPEYKATNTKSVSLFTIEKKSDSEEAFEDQKVRADMEDADVTISRTNGI